MSGGGGGVRSWSHLPVRRWTSPLPVPTEAAPLQRPVGLVSVDAVQCPWPRLPVWRRISLVPVPAEAAPPQRPPAAGMVSGDHEGQRLESSQGTRATRSCRRWRPRFRRQPNQGHDGWPSVQLDVVSTATPVAALEVAQPLPCIIDWSDRIAMA